MLTGTAIKIYIINTPWAPLELKGEGEPPMPQLKPILNTLWQTLYRSYPNGVHASKILADLGQAEVKDPAMYVSKRILQLKQALCGSGSPWHVDADHLGVYRLMISVPRSGR